MLIKNISKNTIEFCHPRAGKVIFKPGDVVDLRKIAAKEALSAFPNELVDSASYRPIVTFTDRVKEELGVKKHLVENPDSVEYK